MAKVLKEAKKLTLEDTFKLELSYAEALIIIALLGPMTQSDIIDGLDSYEGIKEAPEYILPWNSGIDDNLYSELKNHLRSEGFV